MRFPMTTSLAALVFLGVSIQATAAPMSTPLPTEQKFARPSQGANDINPSKSTPKPVLKKKTKTMGIYEARDRYIVEILDPNADFNKVMSDFNAEFYELIKDPADFYSNSDWMLPFRVIGGAISNLLENVTELTIGTFSNAFAGDFEGAGISAGRALVNFGTSAGLYDVATVLSNDPVTDPETLRGMNLVDQSLNGINLGVKELRKPQIENFSDTFHEWGFGCGVYIVLPFLGPSTGRDMAGKVAQIPLEPETYIQPMIIVRAIGEIHSGLKEAARAKDFLKEYNLATEQGKRDYYLMLRTAILNSHKCVDDKVIQEDTSRRGEQLVDELDALGGLDQLDNSDKTNEPSQSNKSNNLK